MKVLLKLKTSRLSISLFRFFIILWLAAQLCLNLIRRLKVKNLTLAGPSSMQIFIFIFGKNRKQRSDCNSLVNAL